MKQNQSNTANPYDSTVDVCDIQSNIMSKVNELLLRVLHSQNTLVKQLSTDGQRYGREDTSDIARATTQTVATVADYYN